MFVDWLGGGHLIQIGLIWALWDLDWDLWDHSQIHRCSTGPAVWAWLESLTGAFLLHTSLVICWPKWPCGDGRGATKSPQWNNFSKTFLMSCLLTSHWLMQVTRTNIGIRIMLLLQWMSTESYMPKEDWSQWQNLFHLPYYHYLGQGGGAMFQN